MKILSTIILLFLTVNQSVAETKDTSKKLKEYDVEIIIFEDSHARYINSEIWRQDNINEPESISDSSNENEAIRNLDQLSINEINASSYKNIKPAILKQKYKRIKTSSEYNVLFYGAWRQAGLNASNAFEININDLTNTHKNKSKNSIAGQFKLVLARYLHIYGELEYLRLDNQQAESQNKTNSAPSSDTTGAITGILYSDITDNSRIYPMNIHRRMRSKELHYIDHPLVGMLIQINPAKEKENTE